METDLNVNSDAGNQEMSWTDHVSREKKRIQNLRDELMKMVIAPGKQVEKMMIKCDTNPYKLSRKIGVKPGIITGIINGRVPIDAEIARVLENTLGIDSANLLKLEAKYRKDLEGVDELIRQNKKEEKLKREQAGLTWKVSPDILEKRAISIRKAKEKKALKKLEEESARAKAEEEAKIKAQMESEADLIIQTATMAAAEETEDAGAHILEFLPETTIEKVREWAKDWLENHPINV